MDDIALSAGLSKGSIYRYFPDKNQLFAETISSTLNEILVLGGGGTPQDRQLFLRRLWGLGADIRFSAAYRLSLIQDPALEDVRLAATVLIERTLVKPLAALLGRTESESSIPQNAALIRARLVISTLLGASLSGNNTPESIDAAVGFLLRACELDAQSPQADGF